MYRAEPDLESALRCALWRTRTVRQSVINQATRATDSTCFIRRPIAILSSASRDVSTGAEERDVIQACLPGGNLFRRHGGRWCTRRDTLETRGWVKFFVDPILITRNDGIQRSAAPQIRGLSSATVVESSYHLSSPTSSMASLRFMTSGFVKASCVIIDPSSSRCHVFYRHLVIIELSFLQPDAIQASFVIIDCGGTITR